MGVYRVNFRGSTNEDKLYLLQILANIYNNNPQKGVGIIIHF